MSASVSHLSGPQAPSQAGASARRRAAALFKVLGVAALLAGASAVQAASHGGGHFSGGHAGVAHFGAARGYGIRAPQMGAGAYGHGYGGYGGFAHGYGGYGHGYGGYGYRGGWAGGYWGGVFWPGAYYGWGYPYFLSVLPALYATYWWDGVPYYYANNVYYTWSVPQNGYVVTAPPPVAGGDAAGGATAPGEAAAPTGNGAPVTGPAGAQAPDVIAYPRNGQSEQQQATDKYECHAWARSQTGFDPTSQSSAAAPASVRSAYGRAMNACLDARGYSAR